MSESAASRWRWPVSVMVQRDLTDEPVVQVELICLRCVGETLRVEGEIVPLYDADLNPINREGDDG